MSFNSPETSYEQQNQSIGNLDALTKNQQQAVKDILSTIDNNPKLGESISIAVGSKFHEVTHDPGKLGKLLDAIEQSEKAKLTAITEAFNAGTLPGEAAKLQAHDTVTHYGHLALTALKDSLQAQTA